MGPTRAPQRSLRGLSKNTVVRYGLVVLSVAAVFALRKTLEPATGTGAPFVFFFFIVLLVSLVAGAGPGILATLLSAPLAAYEFVVRAGYSQSQATVQAVLFTIEGGLVVYLAAQITRARRAAESAGERLELANEAGAIASWDLDVTSGRLRWTKDSAHILGIADADLSVDAWLGLIHPDDRAAFETAFKGSLDPGGAGELRCESRLVRRDGSVRWFSWMGRTYFAEAAGGRVAVRQAGASIDITERRRHDDERRVFVALLENSSDFIGIADPSGKPVWINAAGRRMVGLSPDYPVEETRIADYYPPSERAFATDVIVKSMTEHGHWAGETWFRNWQTGEAIPVSDEHFMIRDSSGARVLGLATVTRDISAARRVTDALRESEERFRLTFDEAPIGMALVELDGRFVRVNRRLCEIVGYPAEELERLRFQDITHPDDLGPDVELGGRLARGEIPRFQVEKRYIRKDGAIVTVLLSVSLLRARGGAPGYFIGQIEDITERKQAEQALRFSEARFSGIVSVSADAVISIDEEQRITLFNQGAERIFGYASADVIGAPLDILLPERLRELHRRDVARFAAGEKRARRMGVGISSIVGRRRNGEEFPADATISKLHVDGSTILTVALRDVTDLKRIERQQQFLAEAGSILSSSLDYEQTLATVGQLVVRELADWCVIELVENGDRPRRLKVVSADPGRAALCNELERLRLDRSKPHLARTAIETRRSFVMERVGSDALDSLAQSAEHLRLLRALAPRSLMELPLLVHGELFGVLVFISSSPFRAYGPADLPFAEALADRAAVAIENGRLYLRAIRATQLREEILGVVAHDLRNPVSAILMQTQLMRRKGPQPERRDPRPRETIQRAAKRMNRLIRDLLDVSMIEAGQLGIERSRIAPAQLLSESVEMQRLVAAKGAPELRLELAGELPEVWGDPHRLLQVLENLIGNATKFTPPHGRISVGAAPRESDVLFWVADTGCGIPPDELPRVFDRFWQARRGNRNGAGLGLPITRGIVEAHGGRIWLESAVERGTTFFFTIPQAAHVESPRSAAPLAGA